ncbi:putative hydrogenase nickel incorporation protein HypA 2 [Alphaproteobacteria bacterium]|nr:putative hydrogenase nickel incorporation protein HypA 2 [Alphaproteobacteria bacterium]
MSLMESVLDIVEDSAKKQGFSKVIRLTLEIGALSSADEQSLRFAFESIKRRSLIRDGMLDIVRIPGQAFCMGCKKTVVISNRYDECPLCGGERLQVTSGDEMRIRELEVE